MYASIGVSYIQKGGTPDQGPGIVKADYIGIPIVSGISPIKTKDLSLSVETGLYLNSLVSSQNPYAKQIYPDYKVTPSGTLVSAFYGVEVSTDAIKNFNLFLNYRQIADLDPFFGSPFSAINNYTEFRAKGASVCAGVRMRLTRPMQASKLKQEINERSFVKPFTNGVRVGYNLVNTNYTFAPRSSRQQQE